MEILGRLAGLAESAWARTHQKETAADRAEEVLPANNFPEQTVATASAVQPDVIAERLIREVQIAERRIREKPAFAAASVRHRATRGAGPGSTSDPGKASNWPNGTMVALCHHQRPRWGPGYPVGNFQLASVVQGKSSGELNEIGR